MHSVHAWVIPPRASVAVDLREAEVHDRVRRLEHVALVQPQRDQRQRDPVGGDDPQHAAPAVGGGRRRRPPSSRARTNGR